MEFTMNGRANVTGVGRLIVVDTFMFYNRRTLREEGGYKPSG